MIYFDNAATTPVFDSVKEKAQAMFEVFGNPSSLHTLGFEAEREIETARNTLSKFLGDGDIYFTSSGTEANNIALLSGAEKNARAGKRIISTDSEHPSVEEALKKLEEKGFDVVRLKTTNGKIDLVEVEKACESPVCLVSVMHTNNETGAIYPVFKISAIVKKKHPRALVHCDCVQALGKHKFSLKTLGADMISLSAHKVHSFKGTGALLVKKGLTLPPQMLGGGQEKGVRSGTENTLGIASFGTAVSEIYARVKDRERIEEIHARLVTLLSQVDGVHLNLPETFCPSILNFSVEGIKSETMLHALSARGIYLSAGSACSSKAKLSPVLTAFGLSPKLSEGALRVSLSVNSTVEEAEEFVCALSQEIKKLKRK